MATWVLRSVGLVNLARRSSSIPNMHLNISRELGDRAEEARAYCNLGNAFSGFGRYDKTIEFETKHLNISLELGDRAGEGIAYGNFGNVFCNLGHYDKAVVFDTKHLNISRIELGDRQGWGRQCVWQLGQCVR